MKLFFTGYILYFQEFFEQDECFSTPVSKQCNSRVPLVQVCNKAPMTNEKSDQCKSNTPLSSQKLKTFAFSRSKLKDVDKPLPPSKRPTLEKELSNHRAPLSSLSTSSMVPHIIDTSPIGLSTVTLPNSLSHTTPTRHTSKTSSVTTRSNSHRHSHISLPVTPLSSCPTPLSSHRPSSKRKFPGPAGLLPKLVGSCIHGVIKYHIVGYFLRWKISSQKFYLTTVAISIGTTDV